VLLIEDFSEDEWVDDFDKTLDNVLDGLHLQLIRTLLNAAKNKLFTITESCFMDIIDNLVFKK